MSSQGLQFKNKNNKVLIDSDYPHYHFAGKAIFISKTKKNPFNDHDPDGLSYWRPKVEHLSDGVPNTIKNNLCDFITYHFKVSNDNDGTPPLCFVKPNIVCSVAFAIAHIKKLNHNTWEVVVMQRPSFYSSDASYSASYVNNTCEVYCFTPLKNISEEEKRKHIGNNQGIQVYNDNNEIVYDSRFRPLKVKYQTFAIPPNYVRDRFKYGEYNLNFEPTAKSTQPNSEEDTNFMVNYASISNACYQAYSKFSARGTRGIWPLQYKWSGVRNDLYWAFYRSVIEFKKSNTDKKGLTTGWALCDGGHAGAEDASGAEWYDIEGQLKKLGRELASTIKRLAVNKPYENAVKNTGEINFVIVAKPSDYD